MDGMYTFNVKAKRPNSEGSQETSFSNLSGNSQSLESNRSNSDISSVKVKVEQRKSKAKLDGQVTAEFKA